MSFILDALKKSELERQRQSIPGLMDSGTPGVRARFPRWAIALVVLLGINLIALLVVLMRSGAPPASALHATAAPTPARSAMRSPTSAGAEAPASAPGDAQRFSPLDSAPVYAPEIPAVGESVVGESAVGEPAGGSAAAGDPTPAPGSAAHQPSAFHPPAGAGGASARAAHRRDPLLTDQDYKAEEEVLPSISELNLSGPQALPELHLDVHVFATKPSERFVYINMRKYREGATLEEGPLLERIRRDGVVLNFQGVRFVLPRQQ
jgi:general secretion pathway protein B